MKYLLEHIRARMDALREHAHAHHKAYHHVHNVLHLGYLGMVTAHGPYYIPAGLLFVVIIIGYALHMEGDA